MPLSIQAFSGIFWIAGYATYYFQLAGFTPQESFRLGIIQQRLSVAGNVCSVSIGVPISPPRFADKSSGFCMSDSADDS